MEVYRVSYYFIVTSQSNPNTITNTDKTLISSIERFKKRIWDNERIQAIKQVVAINLV